MSSVTDSSTTTTTTDSSEWINGRELIDPPLFGGFYIGRENHTISRIDRFLYSSLWEEQFLKIKQKLLPKVTSDHKPVMLVGGDWNFKNSYFKFEQWGMGVEGFRRKMENWWTSFQVTGTPTFILISKLKMRKEKLKEWNEENGGN